MYVGKVNASVKAYEAYKTICENTKAYLETHQDFEGEDRDNLSDYLTEFLEPSEENPYGSYQYVWENMQVTDEELAKEGERVNQWLLDAIANGYIPGTEVTNLMVNADFLQGTEGWNNTSGVAVLQQEIEGKKLAGVERWKGSISNMYQTVEGLKPGYYKVEITGAVRPYNDRYGLNYIGTFDINGVTNYFMADIEDPISVNDTIDGVNCNITGGVNDLAIYEDGVSTSNEEGGDPIGYVIYGEARRGTSRNGYYVKSYIQGYAVKFYICVGCPCNRKHLARVDGLLGLHEEVVTTRSYFYKHKGVVVKHDKVEIAMALAPVSFNQAVTPVDKIVHGDILTPFPQFIMRSHNFNLLILIIL